MCFAKVLAYPKREQKAHLDSEEMRQLRHLDKEGP